MVGDYFQCWTAAIQFSCALYLSTAKWFRAFNHACVMDGLGESCLTMLNSLESWFCEGAMACTRWNKCWCVWWNDLWRNQRIHAQGIPVRGTFSQWQPTYWEFLSCSNLVHEIWWPNVISSFNLLCSFELFFLRACKVDKLRYCYPRGESYLDVIQRCLSLNAWRFALLKIRQII
jgi:hypothetical protein